MSGPIPQHFIDELVQRADIVELINSRIRLKKRGREHIACCPFHDEKTASFTVSAEKQFYHCFGCGAHGTAIGFLMAHERMEFPEAVRALADFVGIPVPESSPEDQAASKQRAEISQLCEKAAELYRQQLRDAPEAIAYLKKRGLSGQAAGSFGLGFAPDSWDFLLNHFKKQGKTVAQLEQAGLIVNRDGKTYDRFRGRVMFPIQSLKGDVIGLAGRILDQGEPKYLNSPETSIFHKGKELYGLAQARASRANQVIVVEGYMDVIALAQHGIDNAVATMGTALTSHHARRVWRYFDEIICCFDGDAAGRRAAWKAVQTLLPELRAGRQVRFAFLPDGHDPDSIVRRDGADVFRSRLNEAEPLSVFFRRHLQNESQTQHGESTTLGSNAPINSVESRAKLVELARPLLAQVNDPVYRDMLTQDIANSAHVDQKVVNAVKADPRRTAKSPSRHAAKKERGSLVRQAVTLLLHYPQISGEELSWPGLAGNTTAGIELLLQLAATTIENPHLTTASLLERFRDHPDLQHLSRLATQETWVSADQAAAELESIIQRLIEQKGRKARARALINKAKDAPITDQEKEELKSLLVDLRTETPEIRENSS